MAMERGVRFGKFQLVDSAHTIADVNLVKDDRRKREGKGTRDAEARWGAKGNSSRG